MSISISGAIVVLLGWLVGHLNVPVAPEALETTVSTVAIIGGAIVAWYGRWRSGGVTWYGAREV